MIAQGIVFIYGDNVDTDVIIPARYLNTSDPAELARHCMEDLDTTFAKRVRPGDMIVAGQNFGCGSSREHAPVAIKAAGISCVICASFSRIFYRNAINIGLPILECEEIGFHCENGEELAVDLKTGLIQNLTRSQSFETRSFPAFIQEIIRDQGLIGHLRKNSRFSYFPIRRKS